MDVAYLPVDTDTAAGSCPIHSRHRPRRFVSILLWADNIIVLAPSVDIAFQQLSAVAAALAEAQLLIKPGSTRVLVNSFARAQFDSQWHESCSVGQHFRIPCTLSGGLTMHVDLEVVGKLVSLVCIDSQGANEAGFKYRPRALTDAWHVQKHLLQDRRKSRDHRMSLLYRDVLPVVLYSACTWTLSPTVVHTLRVMVRRLERRALLILKKPREGFVGYFHRCHNVAQELREKLSFQPIDVAVANRVSGWYGHIKRHSNSNIVGVCYVVVRSATIVTPQQALGSREFHHPRTGRIRRQIEGTFSAAFSRLPWMAKRCLYGPRRMAKTTEEFCPVHCA